PSPRRWATSGPSCWLTTANWSRPQRSRRRLSWRCSLSAPRACRCSRNRSEGQADRSRHRPRGARLSAQAARGCCDIPLLRSPCAQARARCAGLSGPLLLRCTALSCYTLHSPWVCGQRDETSRVHRAARRRDRVAAGGARAAGRACAARRRLINVGNGEWSAYRVTRSPETRVRLLNLEIHRRCFPAVLFDLILDLLPFIER